MYENKIMALANIPNLGKRKFVVDEYIPQDSLVGIIGNPGDGKSLIVQDLCFAVANNLKWCGNDVASGDVLYVCGEGRDGVIRRFQGLQIKNQTTDSGRLFISHPIDLFYKGSITELRTEIKKHQIQPVLIVIDTLNSNFSGEESSAKDFGRVVQNLRPIFDEYHCAVIIVHHAGHNSALRARGTSAIRASLDVEFFASSTFINGCKLIKLTSTKQKDIDCPKDLTFQIKLHEIQGESVPTIDVVNNKSQLRQFTSSEQHIMDCFEAFNSEMVKLDELKNCVFSRIEVNKDSKNVPDAKRKAFERALKNLIKNQILYSQADMICKSTTP